MVVVGTGAASSSSRPTSPRSGWTKKQTTMNSSHSRGVGGFSTPKSSTSSTASRNSSAPRNKGIRPVGLSPDQHATFETMLSHAVSQLGDARVPLSRDSRPRLRERSYYDPLASGLGKSVVEGSPSSGGGRNHDSDYYQRPRPRIRSSFISRTGSTNYMLTLFYLVIGCLLLLVQPADAFDVNLVGHFPQEQTEGVSETCPCTDPERPCYDNTPGQEVCLEPL